MTQQKENPQTPCSQGFASSQEVVPVTGLEPVRCRQRWILSPLRLPFHHTGRCVFFIPITSHRWRFFIVAAIGGEMSPPFAVPGALLGETPASLTDRCTCCTLAGSAAGGARVRSGGFASTTSTIPSHRQVYWVSIHQLSKNSKKNLMAKRIKIFVTSCREYFTFERR